MPHNRKRIRGHLKRMVFKRELFTSNPYSGIGVLTLFMYAEMNIARAGMLVAVGVMSYGLLVHGAKAQEMTALGPRDVLSATVVSVQRALSDQSVSDGTRKKTVRGLIFERLDMNEISKRSLGRHYAAHSSESEFREFTRLFSGLIEKNWLSKVGEAKDVAVFFKKERIDGDQATVDAELIYKKVETHISFRLHFSNGQWRVYDISVEGISLVGNYRSQFNKIISTASFGELIRRLKGKDLDS